MKIRNPHKHTKETSITMFRSTMRLNIITVLTNKTLLSSTTISLLKMNLKTRFVVMGCHKEIHSKSMIILSPSKFNRNLINR